MKEVYLIYASIPSVLFDNKLHEFVKDKMRYKFHNNCLQVYMHGHLRKSY
jgi:hypothetical protein